MSILMRLDLAHPGRRLLDLGRWAIGELQDARRGSQRDPEAYKLLVATLYSSPGSILPGCLAAVLTCLLCWSATGLDDFLLTTAATGIVVVLRAVSAVGYWQHNRVGDAVSQTRAWEREFLLGGAALSLCIGCNCLVALTESSNAGVHLISVAATIAFASGCVARNAGRPSFVTIQLILFCVPMGLGLLMASDPIYRAIGYFTFFFIVNNIAITRSIHRNLLALCRANRRSEGLTAALRLRNLTLDAALNNMNFGIAMFDRDLALGVCNRRFGDLYHLPPQACAPGVALASVLGELTDGGVVPVAEVERLARICAQVVESGRGISFDVVTVTGRNFVVSVEPVIEQGIVLQTEDATERKLSEIRVERMARFDELTGLANRFELGNVLETAFDRRCPGFRFSLLYIDLDNFKQVNDSLGHEAGDAVLVEAATRLRAACESDDLVARFGGDEFVVVQFGPDRSTVLAQRIVESMSAPFAIRGRDIHATASIGIAFAPEHGEGPSDVLRHADLALYRAKDAGRSTSVVFSPEMGTAMAERQDLELFLRRALEEETLQLHYQPIVDLDTGKIVSFEALMRWSHPVLGMVSPVVFIPLAEETGLIGRIGEWAIERACRDAATWPSDVSVAVNVSALQFRQPHKLIATVLAALCESRLAPDRLFLEVTESLLINDQEGTLDAIRALRRLGVKFSLDDFGTGYSSLGYLSTYPFSQVKLDRSFIQTLTSNVNSEIIVEAVCGLSRRLGMDVVVEGIETEEQLAAVKRFGAERAQGYLFGRPQPLGSLARSADTYVA